MNLQDILPLATAWAEHWQSVIDHQGSPLSEAFLQIARKVGVQHPENIKTLLRDPVPMPEDPLLRQAGEKINFISSETRGLTLYYGIFIRTDQKDNIQLYAHEFVHVAQYERLGGIKPFLSQYLQEVLTYGYPQAPLEIEAVNMAKLFK